MIREIISDTDEITRATGIELGKSSKKGDIFGITGGLGAGKTVLAKGIAEGLGIQEMITSPTFTLLEIYQGDKTLYHFDLYRIESQGELLNLNFEEYWNGSGISVIEWADKASGLLPEDMIKIRLDYIDEKRRKITIEYPDN